MRFSKFLFVLIALSSTPALAADRPQHYEKPEEVVAWLYRDYGWEYMFDDFSDYFRFDEGLVNQPFEVLNRYFTKELSSLIIKDVDLQRQTGDQAIVNSSSFLFTGQDNTFAVSLLRLTKLPTPNTILASFEQGEKHSEIQYVVDMENGEWRIADVVYKDYDTGRFSGSLYGWLSTNE
jgi:hypothetical protein